MQAESISIDSAGPGDIAGFGALVVDVDLSDAGHLEQLKAIIAKAPEGQLRAIAVDYHRRLEMIRASNLGATRLMRRPMSEAVINQHLHMGLASEMEDLLEAMSPGVVNSIASAAGVLSGTFEALVDGHGLDMPAVGTASESVIEAIAESGFEEWIEAVRSHHQGTFQHCLIVTGVITAFARSTGMGHRDTSMLTRAGLLHDVGKASIPVEILDKPGRLSEAEMAMVRQHPGQGADYLLAQGTVSSDILSGVRWHHEYLDGSGYPDGLSGADIVDIPRIITVCDIYGALIERRSYKPPMSPDDALAILDGMVSAGKVEAPLVRALRRAVNA